MRTHVLSIGERGIFFCLFVASMSRVGRTATAFLCQSTSPSPRRVGLRLMRQLSSTTRIPAGPVSPIYPISRRGSPRLFSSASLDSTFTTTTNGEEAPTDSDTIDTIFALSSGASATQATALAVIRISGPDATLFLQKFCKNKKTLPKPRVATLRKLWDPETGHPIDHALVLYFPGPHSFTGEDVVELHCHGSRAVVTGVTDALLNMEGSRLAEPGEFTQRAFLAGKMDFLQIEALADLLTADTSTQRSQALKQLDGKLSEIYADWRSTLIAGLAHAEAVIDFGDDEHLDDHEDLDNDRAQWNVWGGVVENMTNLMNSMQKQLQDARRGELIREGLQIAIVGPPNAGKSSLFNLLADRDAAIVSPTAGTTRDILEVSLNLGGVKCIVQDTAGVRTSSEDLIELEGMKRAKAAAAKADLVVAMVDTTEKELGLQILKSVMDQAQEHLTSAQILLVLNKSDLVDSISTKMTEVPGDLSSRIGGTFEISCVTQNGIDSFLDSLSAAVVARVSDDTLDPSDKQSAVEGALITRARHRQHVQTSVEALERFVILSQQGSMSIDMAAEELRLAASELGRITGAVDVEDVLDKLFADFCIGK
jgi:tRNA modification GTPase